MVLIKEIEMCKEYFVISAKVILNELRGKLSELNSLFPETEIFLKSCGKSHVDELTKEELKSLTMHLKQKYRSVLN